MEVNYDTRKNSNLLKENQLDSFINIYRELGKNIREKNENNIKFEYLHKIITNLKNLYTNNKKSILLIGGINVLLPIFEIVYKQLKISNDKNKINTILNELTEILKKIFKKIDAINLAENFNFFQILKLFIEEYDDKQLEIFSNFIHTVIDIIGKQENDELEQFSNFILLFLFDEKLLKIFSNNIKEKILSFIKNNKNKISEKILLQLLLMKNNFNENEVDKILFEKIQLNIQKKNILNAKPIIQNDYKLLNNDNLINNEYVILEKNNEMINEYNNKIGKMEHLKDNTSNKFHQKEKENINKIQNEIINNYYQIFEYNEIINKENKKLIQKLKNFEVNKKESFDNFEKIYFFYLMANKYENNKEEEIILKNKIKEYKQKIDNINYFEYRKIYKQIKKKLFSWNGYYSDFNIFYDINEKNKLKYKIYHFQTNEKVCPYLKPILDMNSYKPNIPKFNSQNIFLNNDYYYSIDLETFPFKKEKIPKNESYKGCLIKTTNHISGNIYLEDKYLLFIETAPLENEIEEYDFIDSKKKCYGNLIYSKSGKGYFKKINYDTINLILPRVYYYNKSGCEIFTTLNKSFYFKFKNEEISEKFYNEIRKIINQNEEDLYKLFSTHQDEWRNNQISNLEYLMWLNIFSNRSYRDIT